MLDSLAGRWDGLMHDVEGFSARSSLALEGKREVKGTVSYQLISDHCGEAEQKGDVRGTIGRDGTVAFESQMDKGIAIRFEGRLFEVKHHAKAAICGIYEVKGPQPTRGGTAIFWLYADPA